MSVLLDVIEYRCCFERLSQKAQRAGSYCFIVQMLVWQSGDQDRGSWITLFTEPSYEVEAAHSGHMNVDDNAIEEGPIRRHEKCLCRNKGFSTMSRGTHQVHQGGTQHVVIVDDPDEKATHHT